MDVASKVIATTTINDAKTFPISYTLKYNPSDIKPGHTYALSARITASGDKLQYINDVRTSPDFSQTKSPTVNIAVIKGIW